MQNHNPLVAETTAPEIAVVGLGEALELVLLAAERAPERFDAFARRNSAALAQIVWVRTNSFCAIVAPATLCHDQANP